MRRMLEPQKGAPHCGSPVGPAGIPREREGVGLKILSAGRDGIPAKFPQLPHCKNTLTLTSNIVCKTCFI
jgi:hypothetical protein